MRLVLPALLIAPLLCGPAFAAADDDKILDDLTVVTATPRPADVRMVVQTARSPSEATRKEAPQPQPQAEVQVPIRTASK